MLVTHANNGALIKLAERVELLEGKRNALETHACGPDGNLNIKMGPPIPPKIAETPSSIRKMTKKKGLCLGTSLSSKADFCDSQRGAWSFLVSR